MKMKLKSSEKISTVVFYNPSLADIPYNLDLRFPTVYLLQVIRKPDTADKGIVIFMRLLIAKPSGTPIH
jgi:hypothetical protein